MSGKRTSYIPMKLEEIAPLLEAKKLLGKKLEELRAQEPEPSFITEFTVQNAWLAIQQVLKLSGVEAGS